MSEEFQEILIAMQEAIDEEMERKAKQGYSAVIADDNGNSLIVPAVELVQKRRLDSIQSSAASVAQPGGV